MISYSVKNMDLKRLLGEDYEPRFDKIGPEGFKDFIVRAPSQNKTALLNFTFSTLPKDENSGDLIVVEPGLGVISLPITVAEKKIVVTMLPDLIDSYTFPRGEEFHPLMAFEISNEGYQDSLIFEKIQLTFLARTDTSLLAREGILDLIEIVGVMDHEAAQDELTKPSDINYVDYTITETNATNPLEVEFNIPGHLGAGEAVTVMVLLKFKAGESSRSFRARLDDVFAYNIDDVNRDSPVTIVDPEGKLIQLSDDATTKIISVTSNDPEKTFGNFPNPFGRAPHETTQISFLLLKDADVTLRIFSLAGELVRSTWNKSLDGLPAGFALCGLGW